MNFALSGEQKAVADLVRRFVDREIRPYIQKWDAEGHFETKILKRLAELQLMGVCIPEKYGGAGMDYNTLAIVCEELERGDIAFRTAVSVHTGLNSLTLLQWGNEEQKEKYLTPQARGGKIGAFGLTEPDAGSDVAAISTTAVRDGDVYRLNGQKTWISLCDVADHFLIFAKTDPSKKHKGISCFIVERTFEGVTAGPFRENWEFAPAIPEKCFWMMSGFRRKIVWGKREKDLRLPCRPWTTDASRWPPEPAV